MVNNSTNINKPNNHQRDHNIWCIIYICCRKLKRGKCDGVHQTNSWLLTDNLYGRKMWIGIILQYLPCWSRQIVFVLSIHYKICVFNFSYFLPKWATHLIPEACNNCLRLSECNIENAWQHAVNIPLLNLILKKHGQLFLNIIDGHILSLI